MRNDALFDHRRRHFLRGSLAAGAMALPVLGQPGSALAAEGRGDAPALPASIRALQPVAQRVVPISTGERAQRLARAQQLMERHRIDAVFIGAGTSLTYFTGMHWWNSERLTGVILPRSGEPVYVTPEFERGRTLEQIRLGNDVRGWQEDEDPYALVAQVLRGVGAGNGTIGIEETVRSSAARASWAPCPTPPSSMPGRSPPAAGASRARRNWRCCAWPTRPRWRCTRQCGRRWCRA
nr:aminopeptidase P family N-terminal domain-containing protein [Stenotrophomonas acidaminiphila]